MDYVAVSKKVAMGEPIVSIKNLRKVFRIGSEKIIALDGVNLEIKKGEVCCLLGTSGSGKSTLLNMMAGLEKPSKGEVVICKEHVEKMTEKQLADFRQKYFGFVFQSYNLLGQLTALENVSMPLIFKGWNVKKRNKRSNEILSAVGLKDRKNHKPTQMSGGQQQRVGIARAFVSNPEIVFADEPTGNLDTRTTYEVMDMMVQMTKEKEKTLIIVTHDLEVAEYADKIIRIRDGLVESVEEVNQVEKAEQRRLQIEKIAQDHESVRSQASTEIQMVDPDEQEELEGDLPIDICEGIEKSINFDHIIQDIDNININNKEQSEQNETV